jgi:ornithine cyclodeaminase/alanine dehydrogenase-like protein (mu-crystallin family)
MRVVLHVSEEQVRQVLKMEDCVAVIEDLFRHEAAGKAESRPTARVQGLQVKVGADYGAGVYGFKAYGNGGYLITIFDQEEGLQGLVDAHWLTQMRTGAVSAVATKFMARPEATTMGIIGTGREARTQMEATRLIRPLSHVKAFSRTPETREAFAAEMRQKYELDVQAVSSPEECVRDVDIITTITNTRDPVLFGAWIQDGVHINSVGATGLQRREIDEEVVARAAIVVVEQMEAAHAENGELVYAAEQGKLDWSRVLELKDVVTGALIRQKPSDVSLFSSFGVGHEDVVVGALALRKAREAGLGTELNLPTHAPSRPGGPAGAGRGGMERGGGRPD